MTSDGVALVCDFGFSRIRHEVSRTNTIIRQGGRPRFVAPELSMGHEKIRGTEASDVYSLAMTIFTLATGVTPLNDIGNVFAVVRAAEEGTRPPRFKSLDLKGSNAIT